MEGTRPLYQERITTDPDILAGKPAIKGTRVSVALVLDYLANNPNFDDFFADYPELTMDDVRACLAYAHALAAGKKVSPAPRRRARYRVLPGAR
jgi:uncharacterized protein (DUF433 family)